MKIIDKLNKLKTAHISSEFYYFDIIISEDANIVVITFGDDIRGDYDTSYVLSGDKFVPIWTQLNCCIPVGNTEESEKYIKEVFMGLVAERAISSEKYTKFI